MKTVHITIKGELPGIRRIGLDAAEAVFEALDSLRGVKRLGDGIKLHTRTLHPNENSEAPDTEDPISGEEEFPSPSDFDAAVDDALSRAESGVKHFWEELLNLLDQLKEDVNTICERDPAAHSKAEVLLLYSGLHALIAYRASHALYTRGHVLPARAISQAARFLTGIEIHPGAQIGRGLFIDHGSGVVIGETAIVGDNCTLYQGVTLGGTGKDTGKRHPTLGDNVLVGAGAKLLGNFTVGDNAKIAAGAVVLGEVPADSTAVGIPARVVKKAGRRVTDNFDQTHIPDPVSQEFCRIGVKLEALEAKLAALENEKEGTDA